MRLLYDAVDPNHIPKDAQMVGGYLGGHWPTFPRLLTMFPNAVHVPIAINAGKVGVYDCESGDLTPQQLLACVVRDRKQGLDPSAYASTYVWTAQIKPVFAAARVLLPWWWEAHYDGIAALSSDPRAVAKQYTNGQTPLNAPNRVPGCDTSVVADYWPGIDPPRGDDMTPQEMLAALDAAAKSTEAGTPVPGTEFIDAIARRVVAMQAAAKGTS